jgi:hypothetical protein
VVGGSSSNAPASGGGASRSPVFIPADIEELDVVLHIEWLGGSCPVQAEGTVDGKPFYFRARFRNWSMGIGGYDAVLDPEWYREDEWGDGEFDAGYMPESDARRLIETCAADYSAGKKG